MLNKVGIFKMVEEFLNDFTIKDKFIILEEQNKIIIKKTSKAYFNTTAPHQTLRAFGNKLDDYPKNKTFTFNIEKNTFAIIPVNKNRRHMHKSQAYIIRNW